MNFVEKFQAVMIVGSALRNLDHTAWVDTYDEALEDGKSKCREWDAWKSFRIEKIFVAVDDEG